MGSSQIDHRIWRFNNFVTYLNFAPLEPNGHISPIKALPSFFLLQIAHVQTGQVQGPSASVISVFWHGSHWHSGHLHWAPWPLGFASTAAFDGLLGAPVALIKTTIPVSKRSNLLAKSGKNELGFYLRKSVKIRMIWATIQFTKCDIEIWSKFLINLPLQSMQMHCAQVQLEPRLPVSAPRGESSDFPPILAISPSCIFFRHSTHTHWAHWQPKMSQALLLANTLGEAHHLHVSEVPAWWDTPCRDTQHTCNHHHELDRQLEIFCWDHCKRRIGR